MVNLNLGEVGQIASSIYGTGNHSFKGMASRTLELGTDAISAAGSVVRHGADEVNTGIKDAQDYFADNAVNDLESGGVITLEGIGEGIGELATDAATYMAPEIDAAKEVGHVVSEVGSDLSQGKIGDAVEETVVGGAKAAVNFVKDVATTAWHGVENFFHGW